MFDLISHT